MIRCTKSPQPLDASLLEGVADVGADRIVGYRQLGRELRGRAALRKRRRNARLARGEVIKTRKLFGVGFGRTFRGR
jgi:hypothetical protein